MAGLKQCYDSEGSFISTDVPCDPNAEVSACCGSDGSQCIDNLHCIEAHGNPVPGTCTDKEWGVNFNPNCPCRHRYVGPTPDYRDSVTFCPDGSYCCGSKQFDCCSAGEGSPIIDYGNTVVIPATSSGGTAMLAPYYSQLAVSTLPITGSGSLSAAATSSFERVSAESTATISGAIATTSPAGTGGGLSSSAESTATISGATATTSPAGTGGGLSSSAKIGVGVGVGAGALLLLSTFILVFLFRRSYRRRQLPNAVELSRGGGGGKTQDVSLSEALRGRRKTGAAVEIQPPVEMGERDPLTG